MLAFNAAHAEEAEPKAKNDAENKGNSKEPQAESLHFGTCAAVLDPSEYQRFVFPSTCINLRSYGSVGYYFNEGRNNYWVGGASGYAGFHLNQMVSFNISGELQRTKPFDGARSTEITSQSIFELQTASLQVGNPAIHHWRVDVGRPLIPFGVDASPLIESFRVFENRDFWQTPNYGGVITFDDQREFEMNLAVVSNPVSSLGEDDENSGDINIQPVYKSHGQPRNDAVILRSMYDISALDGSRLVLSLYGDRLRERRFGFGFVNVSVRNDITHFEIVRRWSDLHGISGSYAQFFRIAYASAFHGNNRYTFELDDERFRYRMGVFGADLLYREWCILRLGLGYRSGIGENFPDRWIASTGVEVKL